MDATLPEPLADRVSRMEDAFSGILGLWAHDLRRRRTYELRSAETFPPASTIKLFVLRELFRQVDAGTAALSERVVMRSRDIVPGTGVLKHLAPGLELSLGDAATLMVVASDNVATNLVIGRLGTVAINRGAAAGGYAGTRLSGKLYGRGRGRSVTTPRDLGALMLDIAHRRAVSGGASAEMLRLLRLVPSDLIVGRFLPAHGGRRDRRWRIASKSGSLPGVRNDVAYVEGVGARYVVALMSRACADPRFSIDNEAALCLAGIARAVHDQVTRP